MVAGCDGTDPPAAASADRRRAPGTLHERALAAPDRIPADARDLGGSPSGRSIPTRMARGRALSSAGAPGAHLRIPGCVRAARVALERRPAHLEGSASEAAVRARLLPRRPLPRTARYARGALRRPRRLVALCGR